VRGEVGDVRERLRVGEGDRRGSGAVAPTRTLTARTARVTTSP
jgi:hypothetical protein